MLLEEIKNIKSGKRDLRNFGITIGVALGALSFLLWWNEKDTYPVFISSSFVLIILGLAFPSLLKPFQKAWMILAVILGWFMTRIILCILFYLVFTSIALLSRAMGRKFIDLTKDYSKNSYWTYRKAVPFNKSAYEKQF